MYSISPVPGCSLDRSLPISLCLPELADHLMPTNIDLTGRIWDEESFDLFSHRLQFGWRFRRP